MRSPRSRRGSVLLVAIGILAVLSVFAVSFASIVRLEARAAANTSDAARARLVAEAGLDRALFLLTRTELRDPITSFHAAWTYRSQDGGSWGLGLPLEAALNPSFRAGATPEGLAYSGVVSGTYRPGGDHFTLRVVGASSRLSLNGQQPTLGAMLDALGRAIEEHDRRRLDPTSPFHDPGWSAWLDARRAELEARGLSADEARRRAAPRDPVAGRGRQLIDLRGTLGGRFQALEQLRAVLPDEDLERLADHVTVDAWLDPAMVGFDAGGHEVAQWRAPVDVNTAPWPVLVACFEGVTPRAAVHPDEVPRPIDAAAARRLATRLDRHRRGVRAGVHVTSPGEPLRGWADLRRLLDEDRDGDGRNDLGLDLTQRAALLANADPNLIYPRRNPDATNHSGLGKVDLLVATTELCFISFGVYEVTSLGRVLGPDGVVVAQHTIHAAAQVYDTLRLLTQADFEAARTSDELEKTASFPNPVRAVTGSFRARAGGDQQAEVVFEPLPDPDLRRRLRVQGASRTSGWVQLIADEPSIPYAAETMAGGSPNRHVVPHVLHVFRFGADLRGEVWKFWDPSVPEVRDRLPPGFVASYTTPPPDSQVLYLYFRERLVGPSGPVWQLPLPEGPAPTLVDRVQAFAVAVGAPPDALGLDLTDPTDAARWASLRALADQLHPPGGRVDYVADLSPDGLLVHPDRRGDLRYRASFPGADRTMLDNRSTVHLWFKLNHSLLETWTPLFEAWHPVAGHPWVGGGANGPQSFKAQVEARLLHAPGGQDAYHLEVRTRRWSVGSDGTTLRPLECWDPDDPDDQPYPEAADFNAPYYSRHLRFELDEARAGEWHYLFMPYFGNVHTPYVDGMAGRLLETVCTDEPGAALARWPLPAWPATLQDRLAPGGFVWPGDARPRFAEATIDELLIAGLQLAIRPPRYGGGGQYQRDAIRDWGVNGVPRLSTRRYTPWGPDHAGSFSADLPAFDADRVKVGRVVWTELQPRRWGLKQYDGGDFQTQGAYRYSTETQREHLEGGARPAPRLGLMSDEYVRYWRLVHLEERIAASRALEERYAALLRDAAPTSGPTFQAYHDAYARERADLEAEKQAILDRWGQPAPPADAGASIAFGADTELTPGAQQVRLRLDFLYFDKAQQGAQPPVGRDGQEWWQATSLNVSPILDDVIVPYQERPRLLRRRDE